MPVYFVDVARQTRLLTSSFFACSWFRSWRQVDV